MVLHNYIGIKTDNMDYVNVKVVQNSLKGDKGWIKRIRAIEEGIEYMCSEGDDSTVKKVLKCKNHLFEILMISKVTGRLKDADVITLEILRRRIYNSYKVFPIVNGHDLKDFKIPSRNYRELLFNCFVYQIENPKATKGEILKHFAKKLNM
ncbi:hypothetical protein PAEPH01_1496 [Pancytospora epiphaga]|nr:hypothetical protein PAEPH01_1496 [Pancytospora epiphaga]